MIVEWLTFEVDPAERDRWLDVDAATWTDFLERQPGFVRKQVLVDRKRPDLVHAVVWWADDASWEAIDWIRVEEVDTKMGPWHRKAVVTAYDVVR